MSNGNDGFLETLNFIVSATGIGLWDWEIDTGIVIYSPEWEAIAGYEPGELEQTVESWSNLVFPEDMPEFDKNIDAHIAGKTPYYTAEFRMWKKDGTVVWAQDKGLVTEWHPDGRPKRIEGVLQDVTELKKAETDLEIALLEIEEYNKHLNEKIDEGIMQLEEERRASQSLYDSNPQINFIADRDFNIIDCNPSTLEFYGFENKEDFKTGLIPKINKAILKVMPNGNPPISVARRFTDVAEYGETSFDTILEFDGEEIPFQFVLKKVPYKGSWVYAVYQTDLRKIRNAEKDLERRDKLLSAVNMTASKLMSVENEDFSDSLRESIGYLGKSAEVERVTIWKNFTRDGELFCMQAYEWCDNVEIHHGKTHTIKTRYSEFIPTWEAQLSSGKCINTIVKDMIPVERDHLHKQGIVSILVIPIFISDEFWGYVGFDDCKSERVFTDVEEYTLKSGGMLIASALLREEMTSNLVAAKEAALSSANAKTAFLANMSHEIRTPMNAIIGMTEIAKVSNSEEQINSCLAKISVASRHLLGIINDILDMSKIEAKKFEISNHEFDFEKMVKNINMIMSSKIEEKNQTFDLKCDPGIPKSLISDELRLSQVITNLLSNAVKFTPENGKIGLEFEKKVDRGDEIEIVVTVTDSGIGIPQDQQEDLFNAFEQADRGISRKYGGTGLGLAISKNILALMGGEISLESKVGKGSIFRFTIEVKKGYLSDSISDTDDMVAKNYDFSNKHLLLIEDVDVNREIIITLLEDTHIGIDIAENGQIGVDKFFSDQDKYDLVFMDIHMPVMDGYSATKMIRSLDSWQSRSIPIVAMTANAFNEDIDKCIESGMNDHIAKPVDFRVLLEKMHKYLI